MFANRKKRLGGGRTARPAVTPYQTDRQDGMRATRPDLEIGTGPTNRQYRNRGPFGLTQGRHRASNMPFYQTNPPILAWKTAFIDHWYNGLHNRILS